jgi:heat shock protein HslJ
MKNSFLLFAAAVALVCAFSCKDSSITSTPIEPKTVASITNIPWRLQKLTLGDSVVNLNNYAVFEFSIGDSTIYGNDGCNDFYGDCTARNESVFVPIVWRTLIYCNTATQINTCLLADTWAVITYNTTLVLRRNDTSFTFSSAYTMPTGGKSFIAKRWTYFGSNDTAYSTARTPKLIPSLKMTANREFGVRWYYDHKYTGSSENDEAGNFGLGNEGLIYLNTRTYSYSHAAGEPCRWQDEAFMQRILWSDHYVYSDSSFRLINKSNGYYYDFVLMQE